MCGQMNVGFINFDNFGKKPTLQLNNGSHYI